jgi:fluoride exporter
MVYLLVFLGGGVGSMFRYIVGRAVSGASGSFPVGTLTVNLVGCILVGMLARYGMNMQAESLRRAALVIGFCGGFTTFSAFSLETASMLIGGRWGLATAYVLVSVAGCLIGATVALGWSRPG